MTTRGKANRAKVGRADHASLALPYAQKPHRGHVNPGEDVPEAYRPFLDALAELLAAEAIRRSMVGPETPLTVNPDDSERGEVERDDTGPQDPHASSQRSPAASRCRRLVPSRPEPIPARTGTQQEATPSQQERGMRGKLKASVG